VFLGESATVAIRGILGKYRSMVAVTRIKSIPLQLNATNVPRIAKKEFLRFQWFKAYTDSLETTLQGRKRKDSLLCDRPHLMDSINYLIHLYLEQSKTLVK